jgi:O-methyltransferase involved in polyketide biosynthesis
MRAGRASRTAEQNALFRALESARPKRERLFDDPFARKFLT